MTNNDTKGNLNSIKFYDLIALKFKDKKDIISSFVIVEYIYDAKKETIKYLDIKYLDKRLEKHVEENPNVIKNIDSYIKNKLLKSEFGFN